MPATFATGQGEGPKDPGPWPDKVLEVMTLPVPKKPCTLCEFWFAVPCLTGVGSFKSVLAKKASFGDALESLERAHAKLVVDEERARRAADEQLVSVARNLEIATARADAPASAASARAVAISSFRATETSCSSAVRLARSSSTTSFA